MLNLNSMEKESSLEKIELTKKQRKRNYDLNAIHDMNVRADKFFLQWLQGHIHTKNKNFLIVECRTGYLNAELATTAAHAHGFDDNKKVINFAKNEYANIPNVSFERIKDATKFRSDTQYDIAIAPFCINNWENRNKTLRNINKSLKIDGEFFAALSTTDNAPLYTYTAGIEFINKYITHNFIDVEKLTDYSLLSNEELTNLLKENGFEIITIKEEREKEIITRDQLHKDSKCNAEHTPLAKLIPDKKFESLLQKYIDLCIAKASSINKDTDEYTIDVFLTVVHARKTKEIDHKK
jgi:2-polyprenyl-3-methyl-5-hydroxy-6-metoxy-1,4-benzoquinol methylase